MSFYYAGFNACTLFPYDRDVDYIIDSFTEISFTGITDCQIGWSYFLLWKGRELYICRKLEELAITDLLEIPDDPSDSCKLAALGKENVIILTEKNEFWQYKVYDHNGSWKKLTNFISSTNDSIEEYPVKALQAGGTVVLTNLGRVFNVPTLVQMPKRVKFIDIACGFDYTILLAENGDVYSMGMGIRGQLGHNDLEDCDNPKLIEALAGLKVVHISAQGWHSAAVTDQVNILNGDLYTWGWNTNGELGLPHTDSKKVIAVPTLVDFTDDQNEIIETFVKKVECGNMFTICATDDGTLWGCGCNQYGQLGQPREVLKQTPKFVKLEIPRNITVKDFRCQEWGTVLLTQ